nr:hypothetical protein [Geotalea toluenoxydans]
MQLAAIGGRANCGTTFPRSSSWRAEWAIPSSSSTPTASVWPWSRPMSGALPMPALPRCFSSSTGSTMSFIALRGEALLERKLRAIRNAGAAGLGVVLVPTLVKGVNTDAVGAIVRQALQMAPTVRGIHFQPVSYFGRFPGQNADTERFTLPELMRSLEEQTAGLLRVADFSPPGGEHAHCSFHGTYLYAGDGSLRPLGASDGDSCCTPDCGSGGIRKTVDTVSRRWRSSSKTAECCCSGNSPEPARAEGPLDLDAFLDAVRSGTFTISAMAFQDGENLDLERLRGCCISVISAEGNLVPFCAYNLTGRDGRSLYRPRWEDAP